MNPRECRMVIVSLVLVAISTAVAGASLSTAIATGNPSWFITMAIWLFSAGMWTWSLTVWTRGAIRRIQIEAYDRMVENMLDQLAWFRETKEQS